MPHLDVIIMAAGRGTRMKSQKPKVLHTLAGKPMLQRLLDTVQSLLPRSVIVVTGFGADQVKAQIHVQPNVTYALQEPQLGTGHAVQQAMPHLPDEQGITLIINGDGPLIEAETLESLLRATEGSKLALLTVNLADPFGYGRIIRDAQNQVIRIVEQKDANDEEKKIQEVNTGVMAAPTASLKRWVYALDNNNAQQEYYLTDIIAKAVAEYVPVVGVVTQDEIQVTGVNSPAQLAALERAFQKRLADKLLDDGVRLADPARIDIRGNLQYGQDVDIDVNCIFEGNVTLGNHVRIGANCIISHAIIADNVVIHPFTHIDGQAQGVDIAQGAMVGPYARLRPGTVLGEDVHVGNFVEIKNSTLAKGAKANHLSYIGDTSVGAKTNIGAGTITANYDGVNKFRTEIGDQTRIGSNCVLVAPVKLGERSTIAAGSVITDDVPDEGLAIGRARQTLKTGWKRPEKK